MRGTVIDTILAMLARGVTPAVPEYGSLGASGDPIPLAHMSLVMSRAESGKSEIDSGEAWHDGALKTGVAAMRDAGIERLVLGAKEDGASERHILLDRAGGPCPCRRRKPAGHEQEGRSSHVDRGA